MGGHHATAQFGNQCRVGTVAHESSTVHGRTNGSDQRSTHPRSRRDVLGASGQDGTVVEYGRLLHRPGPLTHFMHSTHTRIRTRLVTHEAIGHATRLDSRSCRTTTPSGFRQHGAVQKVRWWFHWYRGFEQRRRSRWSLDPCPIAR